MRAPGAEHHGARQGGLLIQDRPSQNRESLSVVVPTFNEQHRIEWTIRSIHAYMAMTRRPYELVVADDGSTDATRDVVAALQSEQMPIKLLAAPGNRGKGSVVRRGVAASTGDLVLMTDADLAAPIEELETLLAHARAGADIVIASRGLEDSRLVVHEPLYRERLGKLFNLLVRALLLPGIKDTQCGFKLFRGPVARRLFANVTVDGFAFDLEVLCLAARAGYTIAEVPVKWSHGADSKFRVGSDGPRMLWDMLKIVSKSRVRRRALPSPPRLVADVESPETISQS